MFPRRQSSCQRTSPLRAHPRGVPEQRVLLLLMLAFFVPAHAQGAPAVVINEVLYDAVGSDTGHEWIELYNAVGETVSLRGWHIERAGTQFVSVFTFPDGVTIAPGGFLLVGESAVEGADVSTPLAFQNGGSATDGMRLVNDAGGVVDVLLYDAPNTNGLPDESGNPGMSFAPDVAEGHSLARVPDGADTNASGADFVESADPTPGAANGSSRASPQAPSPALRPAPSGVVVNEALPNPVGNDAEGEFIELFNMTGAVVDLSGAQLDDAEGGSKPYSISDGTTLAGGAYLLFPRSQTGIALNNEGDAARLLAADGSVVHALAYGKVPREGASWARKTDGSADWTMSPTPGALNVFTALQVAEKKKGVAGTATTSPRASPRTPAASPRDPRSAGALKAKARVQGTAATGASRSSEAVSRTQDAERRESGEGSPLTDASETTGTYMPELPPESTTSKEASPPERFPLPAILAWSAAGIVGIWRFLVTRRG